MARIYLAQGSSRNVFASDKYPDEIIKKPIPERFKAGLIQNATEVENYRIAKKAGLSCFANVTWNSRDKSEIRSERCAFVNHDDFDRRYRNDFLRCGMAPNDDLLKFFAWRTTFAFNRILDAAEKRGIKRKVNKIVGFLDLEKDILLSGGSPTLNLIVDMFLNRNENLKLFRDIFSFSIENKNRLLVDDLWQPSQYGLTKYGNIVVIDYGYSVDLSKSELYGISKKKTNINPDMKEFKSSFQIGNLLFMVDSENRTQMKDTDGIWWTKSTKTVYVSPETAVSAIKSVRSRVDFNRVFRVESKWATSLVFEELANEKRTPLTNEILFSVEPKPGLVPLELYLTEDNVVRNFYTTALINGLEKETIREIKYEL